MDLLAKDDLEADKVNISEQAYQHLRSMIIGREVEPGAVLAERRLAETLQASRTPLRAAINRLEGEGLVRRLSNGSVVILQISVDELLDILFVRRLLEGEAAFLAAERMEGEDVSSLIAESRVIIANPEPSFDGFWRYDDRFHEAIAHASAKPILAKTIIDLRSKARMCHVKRMPGRFGDQAKEHLGVLLAIEAKDARAAKKAMSHHFDQVRSRLLNWLGT